MRDKLMRLGELRRIETMWRAIVALLDERAVNHPNYEAFRACAEDYRARAFREVTDYLDNLMNQRLTVADYNGAREGIDRPITADERNSHK